MKRIFLVLTVATLMAAMVIATAMPAFAGPSRDTCDKIKDHMGYYPRPCQA
jgi:hypothetical protein